MNKTAKYSIVRAFAVASLLVWSPLCVQAQVAFDDRVTRDISGWQVHIAKKLLETEADDTAKALEGLSKMLDEIARELPAEAVAQMKKVPLYFSSSYQSGRSGAEFHPDAGWLRDNGRDPAMAQGVEFSGVHDFEAEMLRMPNFALHELAHAYHFRELPDGFDNAKIKAAFQRAKESGLYDRVERAFGNGKPNKFEKAYAMTNAMEYFAEATEAYFSRNDFFPFTREELARHDPEMHHLLEKLWGVSEKKWLKYQGVDGPGKNRHIVFIAAEQEYRREQSMPMLAKILSAHHGRWHADSTRGCFNQDQSNHPISVGVNDDCGDTDVYRTHDEGSSLPKECTALVWGQPLIGCMPNDLPNEKIEPQPVAFYK